MNRVRVAIWPPSRAQTGDVRAATAGKPFPVEFQDIPIIVSSGAVDTACQI